MNQAATQATTTPDFAELVRAKTATFTPADCQEYIDLADVDFTPGDVLKRWQEQVAESVIDNAADGEIWAIEFPYDEELAAQRRSMQLNLSILEGV